MENKAALPQPIPTTGDTIIYPLVLEDVKARVELGKSRYGTELKSDNGRDALWDAYQEAIDLVLYLRQMIEERDDNAGVKLRPTKEKGK